MRKRFSASSVTSSRYQYVGIALACLLALACGGEPVGELKHVDTREGEGAEAVAGQTATVHYTGWLFDESLADHRGQKFDSSRDRNEPFSFRLGGGEVIAGWDQGVVGMRVGGTRTLTIPPALGYGARGAGGIIPPNATLLFDVELVSVR
jgi:FKBP-type peptidyl-prolyl cis-trans isomerase